MKKRLLTAQGPLQFAVGMIAFTWNRTSGEASEPTEDVLLMYDFLASPEIEPAIADAIRSLSRVGTWSRIVYMTTVEMIDLVRGRYSSAIQGIRERLGYEHFDEIYLARDHVGAGSPLLMNAYPGAVKRAYGDSFGLVGQRGQMQVFDASGWRRIAAGTKAVARRLLLGAPRVIPFDEAVLTLPLDLSGTYFSQTVLKVPPRSHVIATVQRLYEAVPELSEYCRALCGQGSGPSDRIYLLSNLAASGLSSMTQEIALYVDVIETHSPPGSTVYIKPHPRSTHEALQGVVERVRAGRQVVVIDDECCGRLPIELWVDLIRHCQLVAIFSTSAINLKYLYGKDVILPLDAPRIERYIEPGKRGYMAEGNRMISDSIARLDTWDGRSPLWVKPA